MPPSRAKKLAVLERRKNVAQRYLRGQLQWEIARAFEVDRSIISDDLKWVHEQWLAEAKGDRAAWIAKELARIDLVEQEAWRAWDKSKETAEIMKARQMGDKAMTEMTKRGQAGDPRYLDIALRCSARRCELLGLNEQSASTPVIVTVVGGIDLQVVLGQKPGLPPEQRQTLLE